MGHKVSPHNPADIRSLAEGRRAAKVHGNTGTTETISLADGDCHHATMNDNCTFTFSLPARAESDGWEFDLFLKQDGTGSRLATWPASVEWPASTAPTLTTTAGRTDWLHFVTPDGGTNWFGHAVAQDFNEA